MVGPRAGNLRAGDFGIGYEHLPAIVGNLQLVQVKGTQVIHEVAFHLTAEYEDLGSKDIKRVTVSS